MADVETPRLKDVATKPGEEPSAAWWRTGVIVGLAIAFAVGALALLWFLVEPLILVFVAIVIAQAVSPIVRWLEQWLPRALGVVLVYLLVLLVFGGIGWLVFPALLDQAQTLVTNAPDLMVRARDWTQTIDGTSAERLEEAAQAGLEGATEVLVSMPLTLYNSVLDFILVIFMSIYWVIASPALFRFTQSLFPDDRRPKASAVLITMGETMGGYVRGTVIDAVIVGALTYLGLMFIGLEYIVVLAVLAALGEFLPVVGPIVASIPAILIAFVDSPQTAGIVILFYLGLQQVESNLLLPLVMRQQADVPPLLSVVAILAGSSLGGLLGAIIAIPLAGALRVLIMQVLAPAEREWTGADDDDNDRNRPENNRSSPPKPKATRDENED